MIGCLGLAGLLLFMGTWISGYVFYVYFGPANPLLAFAFGAAMMFLFWQVASRFADRAVANDVRANDLRAARERDPNFARTRFIAAYVSRGLGWAATLFFGGIAALCAILAVVDFIGDGGESARPLALFAGTLAALAYHLFPLAKVEDV